MIIISPHRSKSLAVLARRDATRRSGSGLTHIVNVDQGVFNSGNVGDIHVVGGGRDVFQLLLGEDIRGNQVDLGVSVLSSLGGGHVNDLAGSTLDDDETVLSEGRALHGVGGRGTGGWCAGERFSF